MTFRAKFATISKGIIFYVTLGSKRKEERAGEERVLGTGGRAGSIALKLVG